MSIRIEPVRLEKSSFNSDLSFLPYLFHTGTRLYDDGERVKDHMRKNLKNSSSFGEPEVPTLSLTSMHRHSQSASSSS